MDWRMSSECRYNTDYPLFVDTHILPYLSFWNKYSRGYHHNLFDMFMCCTNRIVQPLCLPLWYTNGSLFPLIYQRKFISTKESSVGVYSFISDFSEIKCCIQSCVKWKSSALTNMYWYFFPKVCYSLISIIHSHKKTFKERQKIRVPLLTINC